MEMFNRTIVPFTYVIKKPAELRPETISVLACISQCWPWDCRLYSVTVAFRPWTSSFFCSPFRPPWNAPPPSELCRICKYGLKTFTTLIEGGNHVATVKRKTRYDTKAKSQNFSKGHKVWLWSKLRIFHIRKNKIKVTSKELFSSTINLHETELRNKINFD